ncbi:hypothetical protein QR680_005753 [Steinernema hermaphroditum]|uniref:Uncharacterized protein n=1 Tax=Steinernema hermaphroditum TaxID=289476 RepID=A0AA39HT75_9BILA|nr:hypothetical protein QR680_005753 [Steinernema hermaphroditum]
MFHITEVFVRNCVFFFVCALTFVFAAIFLFLCLFICTLTSTCWGSVGPGGDPEEDYFELESEKAPSWRSPFRVRQQLVEFNKKTKKAKVYAV